MRSALEYNSSYQYSYNYVFFVFCFIYCNYVGFISHMLYWKSSTAN